MSRRRILPSLSSSRQMMIAWKVSGLSQSPAIIASRPASMRLAMAISPSRDRSSTDPISRRYMRTGSSVRSAGSEVRVATAVVRLRLDDLAGFRLFFVVGGFLFRFFRVLVVDDIDAHLAEHRVHVLDLVGGNLLGGQNGVELVLRDPAALFGDLQHPLDGGVAQIEKRTIGGFDRAPSLPLRPSPRPSSPSSVSVHPAEGARGLRFHRAEAQARKAVSRLNDAARPLRGSRPTPSSMTWSP